MTEVDRKRDPRSRAVTVTLRRLAILASVVLNVGFLSGVLARSNPQIEAAAVRLPANVAAPGTVAPDGYTGYGPYYRTLLARGLSAVEAKALVLASLEAHARGRVVEAPPAYWRRDHGSRLEAALRLAGELDRARAVLVEIFGAEAEHDAALARVFRPLDPVFAFLSSAQQLAAQKLKLAQQLKLASALAGRAPIAVTELQPAIPADPRRATAAADLAASLAAVLEPKALHEYLLRDSALAEELRAAGVDFTEAEFRETFDILSRLEGSRPDPAVYASARDSLRALLGGRRLAALWAGRDPLFGAIKRAAESHALEEETMRSVYELFNDHHDSLLQAALSAAGDGEQQSRALTEAQTRLHERLSGLVGADAAADIERSYAQQAMRLSQQFSQP